MPARTSSRLSAQLKAFRDELYGLVRDLGAATRSTPADPSMAPAVDVVEYDDRVEIRLDLMGFGPDELVVEVEGDILRLRGSRLLEVEEAAQGERFAQRRRRHFLRGIQLPPFLRPETVEARYDQGLLTIHVRRRRENSPAEPTRPKLRR
jgi:HSP20 family protein